MLARLNLDVEWPVSDGSGCWPDWLWLSSGRCQMGSNVSQAESRFRVVSVRWVQMLARLIWLSSGQCQMGPDVGQAESGCRVVSVRWARMLARLYLAVKLSVPVGSHCWPEDQYLFLWQMPSCFFFLRPYSQMLINILIQARRLPFKSRPFYYSDHPTIVQCLKHPGKRSHCIVKVYYFFTCLLKKYTIGFTEFVRPEQKAPRNSADHRSLRIMGNLHSTELAACQHSLHENLEWFLHFREICIPLL